MKTDLAPAGLKEFTDAAYAGLQHVQKMMERSAISDGGARWVTAPHQSAVRVRLTADGDSCVQIVFQLTSDEYLADLSWMAARAYSYALYSGCLDLIKRRAVRVATRRYIPVGESEILDATIGSVTARMLVAHQPIPKES